MTAPLSDTDLLERMIRIDSPSGSESALAEFLAGAMHDFGLKVEVDEVGNVSGTTGTGAGPSVLLLGHLDTVPEPLLVSHEGGVIRGRGAVDAKGPLAAMIMAVAASKSFPGRVTVAGVVEEETPGSRGAVHVRSRWSRPDLLVVGEPSGWQNVTIGYKGKLDIRYRVSRRATHPSNPAEKATEVAARFWSAAVAAAGPGADHAVFDRPGVTLMSMSGDTTSATLDISYRIPIGFDVPAMLGRLEAAAAGGAVEVLNVVTAVRSPRHDPVVRALTAAIRSAGGAPKRKLKTGTSDMNTLAEVWPVPMATYGPGDSNLDHSANEHISVDEYQRGISVLRGALNELVRFP